MKRVLSIFLILLIIFLYATFLEPHLFRIEKRTLDFYKSINMSTTLDEEKESTSLKIIQFSDTQLGPYYDIEQLKKVVNEINGQSPDIIVFTGDFFDHPSDYDLKKEALELLKKLDDKALKIAIFGNHDVGGGGRSMYETFMSEAGFLVLVNEMLSYKAECGKTFDFYGIDDGMLGKPDFGFVTPLIDENHYNILILHEPDLYTEVASLPFDLILSGHSHGGQIKLPFLGPLVTPPLSKVYKSGYYEIDNPRKSLLYVNTGLGNTKMRYRFGNIPQIAVFTIE